MIPGQPTSRTCLNWSATQKSLGTTVLNQNHLALCAISYQLKSSEAEENKHLTVPIISELTLRGS